MSRVIEDIQNRIEEVEKLVQSDIAREKRIFDVTKEFHEKSAKTEVAGLGALIEKMGWKVEPLNKFFADQEKEAIRRIETVTPLLQLSESEIKSFASMKRALLLINPCLLVPPGSPMWKCVYLASSCGTSHSETTNASASCTCTPSAGGNEFNARVEARGYGTNGSSNAIAQGWFYFDIPARTVPTTVAVHIYMPFHGFYILRPGAHSASLILTVKAGGSQYGYSWNSITSAILNLSGDKMGRHDAN